MTTIETTSLLDLELEALLTEPSTPYLLLMRGLPGSGKSTLAKEWVAADPEHRVRVSRDDLRTMLFDRSGVLTYEQEKVVTEAETRAARAALESGRSVVVDAMHLAARYIKRWEKIGYPVDLYEVPTPIEECIERDSERDRSLGEKAIRAIARRFSIPEDGVLPKYVPSASAKESAGPAWTPAPPYNPELSDALIVDTDGTLADLSHRSPYAKDAALYYQDGLFEDVARIVAHLGDKLNIIGVSGRDEEFRDVTLEWWAGRARLHPDAFFMRAHGDTRKDDVVKAEIFDREISGKYNVVGVLDDRPRVLRMWHAKGLTTFRVGDPTGADF